MQRAAAPRSGASRRIDLRVPFLAVADAQQEDRSTREPISAEDFFDLTFRGLPGARPRFDHVW